MLNITHICKNIVTRKAIISSFNTYLLSFRFIGPQILNFERSLSLSLGPQSSLGPPCKISLGRPWIHMVLSYKIFYKELNVPLDINRIGRFHPIGEAKDRKVSIIVGFLTYRQTATTHIGRSHPIGEAKYGKISIIVRFPTYRQRPII